MAGNKVGDKHTLGSLYSFDEVTPQPRLPRVAVCSFFSFLQAIHGGAAPTSESVSLGIATDDPTAPLGAPLGPGLLEGLDGLDGLHGRRLAPYHPGPGAHEFQGQMLAHAHLGLLAEAADLALREAHAIGRKRGALKSDSQGQDSAAAVARRLESWWAAPGLEAPEPNKPPGTASASAPPTWKLPPPVGCHRAFCESGHFQCFTTYTPRHADFDLAKLVLPTAAAAAASSQGRAQPKAALPRWGPRPQGHPKGTWAIASPPNTNADHHKSFG